MDKDISYQYKVIADCIYNVLSEKFEFIRGISFSIWQDDDGRIHPTMCIQIENSETQKKLDSIGIVDSKLIFEDTDDYWYHLSIHEDIKLSIVKSMKYISNKRAHEYGIRFV